MSDQSVLYIVKSVVNKDHAESFNRWYHEKHIPEMLDLSGCISARRFEALATGDDFTYMAVYEFKDKNTLLKYQESEEKQRLIADYRDNFGNVSELQTSSWIQIFP